MITASPRVSHTFEDRPRLTRLQMSSSFDGTLELNDATSYNAQSPALMSDMGTCMEALNVIHSHGQCQSIIFQGVGPYFCTGG